MRVYLLWEHTDVEHKTLVDVFSDMDTAIDFHDILKLTAPSGHYFLIEPRTVIQREKR